MEVIKRTINLEDYTDRGDKSKTWGAMTASTFFIKIILTQTMDDMGLFTDIDFVAYDKNNSTVDYTILKDKLNKLNQKPFSFMQNKPNPIFNNLNTPYNLSYILRYPTSTERDYYNYVNAAITGMTESKIEDLKSYDRNLPYRTNFDINKETWGSLYDGIKCKTKYELLYNLVYIIRRLIYISLGMFINDYRKGSR